MSRVSVYSGAYPRRLHGLGAQAICLDQNENAVSCQDPECTYGDCGAVSSFVPSGGCLDQRQNQVLCMDPECTYGDCLPPAPRGISNMGPLITATAATLTPRPSPVLNVPLSMSSTGLFFASSTLIGGIPNWMTLLGGLAVAGVFLGGSGRRRR